MSINISATNSNSQLNSQLNTTQAMRQCGPESAASTGNQASSAGSPRQAGLLGAIANALQDLGANVLSNAEGTQDASTTDVSGTTTNDTAGNESSGANAAQALGAFLQDLMAALQKEGGAGRPQGNRPPPPPMDGGSGGIAKDLQKLIAELSGQATTDSTSTSTSNSTDVTALNVIDPAVNSTENSSAALSNSFGELLNALGVNAENSQQKLQSFLQNILSQVSQNGRQGNFINTSA